MGVKPLFGALSVIIYIGTVALYMRSSMKGPTRPHAFSWGIWALTGIIVSCGQTAVGAGPGAWLQAGLAGACFCIMLLALTKRGDRSYARQDWIALILALGSVPLWWVTGTPLWSVVLIFIIDTVGFYPTWRKSWHKPYEEPARLYICWSLSGVCSLIAVENYSVITTLSSIGIIAIDLALVALLLGRRKCLKA